MGEADDVRQVLMHGALVPAFENWLASRGLELHCIGKFRDDDLPCWVVSPTDETLRRLRREEPRADKLHKTTVVNGATRQKLYASYWRVISYEPEDILHMTIQYVGNHPSTGTLWPE